MTLMQILLKRYKFLLPVFVLIFAGAFTACNDDDDDDDGYFDGTGNMQVLLTDAPAFYDEVNIDIRQVLVNKDTDEDTLESDDSNWEVIFEDSIRVNLLDYQHGETMELGEAELEAGRYNQLRLVLGANNDVVIGGETFALTTPSGQQSGYKLNIQADVEEGEVYELVIDFDATQSVKATGNNSYILRPVLRTVDLEQDGSIVGTVLPIEAEPYIYAILGEDTVGTQPDEDGDFRITGLNEGTYEVNFVPTDETYADTLFQDIIIEHDEVYTFEETIILRNLATTN